MQDTTSRYRQAKYRKKQEERGYVKLQIWVRPNDAEFIKAFVRTRRQEERRKQGMEDAA